MTRSSCKSFRPKAEQIALLPEVSGNEINGLGETNVRPATHVYWHDPDTLPHGKLQKWFYTQHPDNEAIIKAREDRARILEIEVPPVAATPERRSAAEWATALNEHAATLDMELLGITALRPEWVFSGEQLGYKWVIMIGLAHDYEEISKAPHLDAGAEVVRQYGRGNKAAKDIAGWIRTRGWDARPLAGPMAGPMLLIPPAIECGFGELGRHGSIINKDYGSSFRLAAVLTDVPLLPTRPVSYNVDDFCTRCQVCSNACPTDAILPTKRLVRGQEKWYVDFDKCIPFFNENAGCAICIAVCPWSIPGKGPRIIEQLQRRAAKHAADK